MTDAPGLPTRSLLAGAVLVLAAALPIHADLSAAGPAAPSAAPQAPAAAIDVVPHRAVYSMSLASAKNSSGVVQAHGALSFEWGDSCDGWTIEQRYKLQLSFSQNTEAEITTNYVTWEAKDGTAYRFNVRKTKNGAPDEQISGWAKLDGPGLGGTAEFTLPRKMTMKLPPGTIFPTQHTLVLLQRAIAGDRMVPRTVFDGATPEGAAQVSALIGRALPVPGAAPSSTANIDALLTRPGWYMRMAYFGIDKTDSTEPDYEIGMDLQDNGVARGIRLDYSDFSIKGTLEKIEKLAKPPC